MLRKSFICLEIGYLPKYGSSIGAVTTRGHSQSTKEEKHDTEKSKKAESKRLAEFRKKIRETTSITDLGDQPLTPQSVRADPLPPWPNNTNPYTGEVDGPRGLEPTRYGDWERKGRVSDF